METILWWCDYWRLYTLQTKVPTTEDLDFLTLLTDEADIAAWNNESLPSDRMSTENATILVCILTIWDN